MSSRKGYDYIGSATSKLNEMNEFVPIIVGVNHKINGRTFRKTLKRKIGLQPSSGVPFLDGSASN